MGKENIRRKIHPDIESVPIGFANGQAQGNPLTEEEKQSMIEEATIHYGRFLDALKCDWRNDPNSMETPKRVSKAYVNDLWRGRYDSLSDVTSFPSDGYRGIVLEKDIPVVSQCSHHHQTILGKAHIAYIPGEDGRVIGLSKLNRIVEHFSRRGAIQESLTMAIHGALNKVLKNTDGVMVVIQATHNCVSCRGVKHMGASMITSEVSGAFADHKKTAKQEVMHMIGYGLDAYR
jgi:GTP cyclohydrolase I|tara:strand:- start:262 stop:960 length:699 start_codon:yes stop_codon:yes gene_type:complete